jgi:predicted GNAT superfamily acetyltransferase
MTSKVLFHMTDTEPVRHGEVADSGIVSVAAAAREAALAAASRIGLRVTELTTRAMHEAATALFAQVWQDQSMSPTNPELLKALEHTGNYVAGAFLGDQLVGASVGIFAVDRSLHSHVTGIAPESRGLGVGYALKQHQRAWALARGVDTITWTFDPLVRRNAFFNLHKLGACLTAYLPDFYGAMTDSINAGDLSDRLFVCWLLTSPRAVAAAGGRIEEADLSALPAHRHVRLDRLDRLDGERPEPRQPREPPWLVAVPKDIERLRRTDAGLARAWRLGVREALLDGLDHGLRITAMSRDGWYVMRARA